MLFFALLHKATFRGVICMMTPDGHDITSHSRLLRLPTAKAQMAGWLPFPAIQRLAAEIRSCLRLLYRHFQTAFSLTKK
jgi:hypothetical protein